MGDLAQERPLTLCCFLLRSEPQPRLRSAATRGEEGRRESSAADQQNQQAKPDRRASASERRKDQQVIGVQRIEPRIAPRMVTPPASPMMMKNALATDLIDMSTLDHGIGSRDTDGHVGMVGATGIEPVTPPV